MVRDGITEIWHGELEWQGRDRDWGWDGYWQGDGARDGKGGGRCRHRQGPHSARRWWCLRAVIDGRRLRLSRRNEKTEGPMNTKLRRAVTLSPRTDLGRGAGRRFNQEVMMIPDRHMDVETSRHAVYVSSMIYLDSGHIPGSRRPLFAIIKFFLAWPVRATIRLGPMGRDSTPNDRPAKTAQSYQSLARVMTRNDNEQAFFFQASPTRNSGSGRLRSGGF